MSTDRCSSGLLLQVTGNRPDVTIDDLLIDHHDWAPERSKIGIAPPPEVMHAFTE